MANPILVDTPAGVWKKVASAVTSGNIYIVINSPTRFLFTYRDADSTNIPTGVDEAALITGNHIPIKSSYPIDVYIQAQGEKDGKVRVDL